MADRRSDGVEHGINLAADEIGQRRPGAAVVHLDHVDARHHLEQLGVKMRRAPWAG